jgi:predicted double-glycine peptidase
LIALKLNAPMRTYGLALLLIFTAMVSIAQTRETSGIWLDVPFVRQSEDGCGSASIAMLLQYWNAHGAKVDSVRADANAIQEKLYSRKAHGIFASDLENYLKDSDFHAFSYQGTWDDLREHLIKGRPLIVGLQPGRKSTPLHYVVVTGMDWEHPAVFVNDPARGKLLRVERAEFEKEWQPLRNWLLLAVPQHID